MACSIKLNEINMMMQQTNPQDTAGLYTHDNETTSLKKKKCYKLNPQ